MRRNFSFSFLFLSLAGLMAFQNCGQTEFKSIPSTTGDITDPVIQNSKRCDYDGKEYLHTEVIETFVLSSVGYNQSCQRQKHTCQDGTWTGKVGFKDCGVEVPKDCKIGDETIRHGDVVQRFQTARVAQNQNCISQERRCTNGFINGTFTFSTCRPDDPPAPTGKLECVRRMRDLAQPPAIIEILGSYPVDYRQDIYEQWSDGTRRLKEKCLDWHQEKENPALNCGAQISGTSGLDHGVVLKPVTCCPVGRVSINGSCQTESSTGGYCFANSQCAAGLRCLENRCQSN